MGTPFRVQEEKCVGCGLCAKNCPVGAAELREKKARISALCVGCGICAKVCKAAAIESGAQAVPAGAGSAGAVADGTVAAGAERALCRNCPIGCRIPLGGSGACRRYENRYGRIQRTVPLEIVSPKELSLNPATGLPDIPLLLGLGAGTNLYSTDVPARIIAEAPVDGVDIVSCVTETILSFQGARVKVDTDEDLGPAGSPIRRDGAVVGYVCPSEYGSRMLYFGGAELNTGSGGFTAAKTMAELLNHQPVTVRTAAVKELTLRQGCPPIVDGKQAKKMRIGCGSYIVNFFCLDWMKVADEVIAVDYDITAKMSTHMNSGLRYGMKDSGITPRGRYSSPGRYFGEPGAGWGGSNVLTGRQAIAAIARDKAWPGLRLVVTEPTAERAAYFELDQELNPVELPLPPAVEAVLERIRENCEDCGCHVSVMAGFGGGVRNVISRTRPLNVNRALREGKIRLTICGRPVHVLAGGGITAEASVADMPPGAFTWVPTPAGVCPMEMTMTKKTYEEIGGYLEAVRPLEEIRRDNPAIEISLATPSVIPRREGAE